MGEELVEVAEAGVGGEVSGLSMCERSPVAIGKSMGDSKCERSPAAAGVTSSSKAGVISGTLCE